MNKIIVGNMKNFMNFDEVKSYIAKIKLEKLDNVILCPTNIYIPYFINENIKVGLQNFLEEDKVCTGEISPIQAKSLNINYVIIGHNERRKNLNETNEVINKKIKIALENNITPILCVGEEFEDRNNSKEKINIQLKECLKDIENKENIIVVYEPTWAIGTNQIPTRQEISDNISFIKDTYHNIKVLYGGSINENNIEKLNKIENLDGFLIGKASTKLDEFLNIIKIVENK